MGGTMPRHTLPRSTSRLLLIFLTLGPVACSSDAVPTANTNAQFEGIGPWWNPEWQGPVLYFAPIVYQDVDASWADFISNFAFDQDWNGGNNWDNTFSYPLYAFVYTSVVETFAHYFIFYGFFHPRGWCTINFPLGWFCDWPVGHEHENDLEGIMVTVDKRFTTAEWPYGQIVTSETVFHTEIYPAYRNCTFAGYTVAPSFAFKSWQGWDGCIVWEADDMMFTPETPPARPAIFVQARGHGVKMRDASWSGFPGGDGVLYYPAEYGAEVPPSVLSPAVRYELQWLTHSELWFTFPASLWSKRLTSGGLATSTYKHLHQDAVGPWDVLYGHDFNCLGQPCGANAPWGIKHDAISTVHKGDWHNHPAWTWSQHYDPGPTWNDTLYYPYCRTSGCRMASSMYESNVFWDPAAAPQDYVDYHMVSSAAGASEPVETRSEDEIPPEIRWEFDAVPALELSGQRVRASHLTVEDADWGYTSRSTAALRLEGDGTLELTLPGALGPSRFRYAYVRFRTVEGSSRTVALAWRGAEEATTPVDRRIELPARRAGAWQVATSQIGERPEWSAGPAVSAITVVLQGDGPAVVEIDFVILAP